MKVRPEKTHFVSCSNTLWKSDSNKTECYKGIWILSLNLKYSKNMKKKPPNPDKNYPGYLENNLCIKYNGLQN